MAGGEWGARWGGNGPKYLGQELTKTDGAECECECECTFKGFFHNNNNELTINNNSYNNNYMNNSYNNNIYNMNNNKLKHFCGQHE